jgi:methyl-accepting chemotaxis protein
MPISQILLIVLCSVCFLLLIALGISFSISRKSQKVMESLLAILTTPERAQITDASRVLSVILADEIAKIKAAFNSIQETLQSQIDVAENLHKQLGEQNDILVNTADDATKKVANMSQRLENTVGGLQNIVDSESWHMVENSADKFVASLDETLGKINTTTNDVNERVNNINEQISNWIESGNELNNQLNTNFENNTNQMKNLNTDTETMKDSLGNLSQSVSDGFEKIKTSASGYEEVLRDNDKLMNEHLVKLDAYSKQAKKQLVAQTNTLTNTANVVASQVQLAESSIDKQTRKLVEAVDSLMTSATTTEASVRGVSSELSGLTNHFNSEIKEFATDVVSEIKTVSGVANVTLENTKSAANAFSESVKTMATGVRETLIEMNTAHTQLSGQSQNLIKLSADTTAQLQPLSELIERYYAALPDLSQTSLETNDNLNKIVSGMEKNITLIKQAVADSTNAIAESAVKLEDLASQSRQQMIDLMSDYAKAVNTMQTLNKQMMVARATAPMEAIKSAPTTTVAGVSGEDFLKHVDFGKLNELSMDLTQAIGAEIPDVVWKKYHDGDTTIFAKWLSKMLSASDKKQIRDLLKSDAIFRSQASQFVRGFDKIIEAGLHTDTPDAVKSKLLKTDLGNIYTHLKGK